MYTALEYQEALQYFTQPNHLHSFEILEGERRVMLSAPHAVIQTRNGRIKQAERYTGVLCRIINRYGNCPCIYKARHMGDDANHDAVSAYRDVLCQFIRKQGICYLLDLHQLAPERTMDVCLCTGKGVNLLGKAGLPTLMKNCFAQYGFNAITVDDPFDASSSHTVSSAIAKTCGIPAVQVELNTRLLLEHSPQQRFRQVAQALMEIIKRLDG